LHYPWLMHLAGMVIDQRFNEYDGSVYRCANRNQHRRLPHLRRPTLSKSAVHLGGLVTDTWEHQVVYPGDRAIGIVELRALMRRSSHPGVSLPSCVPSFSI